jgi:hypothetical protein
MPLLTCKPMAFVHRTLAAARCPKRTRSNESERRDQHAEGVSEQWVLWPGPSREKNRPSPVDFQTARSS